LFFPPLFLSVQAFSFLVIHGFAELVPIASVYQRAVRNLGNFNGNLIQKI